MKDWFSIMNKQIQLFSNMFIQFSDENYCNMYEPCHFYFGQNIKKKPFLSMGSFRCFKKQKQKEIESR